MEDMIYKIAQGAPGMIAAIVFHEWAHGFAAKKFGDNTAERAGRLSLNPSVHIDPIGTIIFPMIGLAIGGVLFGWAKPVPIDTRNFKERNKAIFWVSFAGPLANLALGFLSAFLFIISLKHLPAFSIKSSLEAMLQFSIMINFVLMIFNLIPLPPLDGAKMVSVFLKGEALRKYEAVSQYSFFIMIGALVLSSSGIIPILQTLLAPAYWLMSISVGIFNIIL